MIFKRRAVFQLFFVMSMGLFGLLGLALAWSGQAPATAAALPTPRGTYPAPRRDPQNWEVITFEGFEGGGLPTNWSALDLSNDGFERFWGVDDYLHATGSYAIWPARGGANGRNPTAGNDHYFNNMNTRLMYQFDFRNSDLANVQFQLLTDLDNENDYIVLEVSPDGQSNFQEIFRRNYSNESWPPINIYFANFAGDDSVWLSWRFYSNHTGTDRGAWIDNVEVAKRLLPTPTPSRTPTATMTPTRTPTPRPQNNKVYLGWVRAPFPIKTRSGIHLGTRESGWPSSFLTRLQGTANGKWPAAVVVLSNNVYNIERNTPNCTVSNATVRDPMMFDYLKRAYIAGTKIIIRIEPSPGNFADVITPSLRNDLIYTPTLTPDNHIYCEMFGDKAGWQLFRAVDDVAREMKAIHDLNVSKGWIEFGFEPANEPNIEWYSMEPPAGDFTMNRREVWQDMNFYFTYLYNYVHDDPAYDGIGVLTPPMAQHAFAEEINFTACDPVIIEGSPGNSGYDLMYYVYQVKNDGITWHNYFRAGQENWDTNFCPDEGARPTSDHLVQFFPALLQNVIFSGAKPTFITEGDLLSPCYTNSSSITNKDTQPNATVASLRQFIRQELGADIVVVWLLTTGYSDSTATCDDNDEHAWHEVYREDGTERQWFQLWWLNYE